MQYTYFNQQCNDQTASPVLSWIRQAGKIALHYFKRSEVRYKSNQTLITQADIEIERYLIDHISDLYPDDQIVGEESQQKPIDPSRPNIWAVDPLDGTAVFSQGLPGWGISVGLLRQGKPYFGCFYMPLLDDMTYTREPDSHLIGETVPPPQLKSVWGPNDFLAVSASTHRKFHLDVPGMRALGSVGASLVYTARGAAAAALIPKARLWDLVAGAAILEEAGGTLRYLSGRPIDYLELLDGELAPEPIIAGHPNLISELQQAIRPL
ncbi:MAG: inositol monophosphatase [Anaerolineae bacterium]|nr:inositol monophosphatase [Anaerolineae bacterium]